MADVDDSLHGSMRRMSSNSSSGSVMDRHPSLENISPTVPERKDLYNQSVDRDKRNIMSNLEGLKNLNLGSIAMKTPLTSPTAPSPVSNFSFDEPEEGRTSAKMMENAEDAELADELRKLKAEEQKLLDLSSAFGTKGKNQSKQKVQHTQKQDSKIKILLKWYDETIEQLEKDLEDSEEANDKLEGTIISLQKTIDKMFKEADLMKGMNDDLNKILSETMSDNLSLKNDNKKMNEEKKVIMLQSEKISRENNDLTKENEQFKKTVATLHHDQELLRMKISSLEVSNEELDLEFNELKDSLAQAQKQLVEKSDQVAHLLVLTTEQKEKSNNVTQLNHDLSKERDEIADDFHKYKARSEEKIAILDKSTEDLSNKLKVTEKSLIVEERETKLLKTEIERLSSHIQENDESRLKLSQALEEKEQTIKMQTEKIELLQEVIAVRSKNVDLATNPSIPEKSVQFDENSLLPSAEDPADENFTKEQKLLRKIELLEKNNLRLISQIKSQRMKQLQVGAISALASNKEKQRRVSDNSAPYYILVLSALIIAVSIAAYIILLNI